MENSNNLVVAENVRKSFGQVQAIDGVSFNLRRGGVCGLVGGNGAGKTTLLRLLSGVVSPDHGNLFFVSDDGAEVSPSAHRAKIGVLPESTGLYQRLSGWENIRYHARLHGLSDEVSWQRTLEFAKRIEVANDLNRATRGFSRGMRQKIALLRALVHGPDLLLLDEPTAGLDITSARTVRDLVKAWAMEGGTVIYSTHRLEEADRICDSIIIMHNGLIRAIGSPEEIRQQTGTMDLEGAFVSLTSDHARDVGADAKNLGILDRMWTRIIRPRTQSPLEDEE